jgi:hypothetical protein
MGELELSTGYPQVTTELSTSYPQDSRVIHRGVDNFQGYQQPQFLS